jgi:hypothetical protein
VTSEPLVIDTGRLKRSGAVLQELRLPTPPAKFVASGPDPMSAAVNSTLPEIEAPVIERLPAIEVALGRTATKMVTAAGMYADTDQMLGARFDHNQFHAVGDVATIAVTAGQAPEAEAAQAHLRVAAAQSQAAATATTAMAQRRAQMEQAADRVKVMSPQFAQMGSAMGSFTQGVTQGVQGGMSGTPTGGPTSAPLAKENADRERLRTDDEDRSDEREDGASPGADTSESVPAQAVAGSATAVERSDRTSK